MNKKKTKRENVEKNRHHNTPKEKKQRQKEYQKITVRLKKSRYNNQ